jgi:hypothetical protein
VLNFGLGQRVEIGDDLGPGTGASECRDSRCGARGLSSTLALQEISRRGNAVNCYSELTASER